MTQTNLGNCFLAQDHITPEELAELEAAEEWVELQSALEEEEEEHVIAVALR